MERQLLARSRFFNGSQDLDALLQSRYSRTGDQKSFIILKPTGANVAEAAGSKSLLHSVQNGDEEETARKLRSRKQNRGGNQLGYVDPEVYRGPQKTGQEKASKGQTRKTRALMDKKNKKTTRLVFRAYIRQTIANQRKVVSTIASILSENRNIGVPENRSKQPKDVIRVLDSLIEKYNIPRYEDYLDLTRVWHNYVQDLLQLDRASQASSNPSAQLLLSKLSTAEYIGAIVRVVASEDTTVTNMVGMVLYEYKNFFVILVPRGLKFGEGPASSIREQNAWLERVVEEPEKFTARELVGGIKMIEKKTCVFKIIVPVSGRPAKLEKGERSEGAAVATATSATDEDGKNELTVNDEYLEFQIIGPRFNYKSIDRSNKKFKSHNVNDLGLLVRE